MKSSKGTVNDQPATCKINKYFALTCKCIQECHHYTWVTASNLHYRLGKRSNLNPFPYCKQVQVSCTSS